MNKVIIGIYEIDGKSQTSVEVPFSGNAKADYVALDAAMRKQLKSAKPAPKFKRLSSKVELRDRGNAYVDIRPGAVIRNLFEDSQTRAVGKTFYCGGAYEILLRFMDASNEMAVSLKSLLPGGGILNLPNRVNGQRLAAELPGLIKEILGGDAREIALNFRQF